MTFRHEIKAIIPKYKAEILKPQIASICLPDTYADASGKYYIKSIYFDTADDKYYNETVDGVNIRHKYRVRTYNGDLSHIKLECKSTENGLKHKDSSLISLEELSDLLERNYHEISVDQRKTLGDFINESLGFILTPKTIIGYERTPFIYPIGNVRVTFDENIYATRDISVFYEGYNGLEKLVCREGVVLEVKYDEILPQEISNILNRSGIIWQTAFSKYATSREVLERGY